MDGFVLIWDLFGFLGILSSQLIYVSSSYREKSDLHYLFNLIRWRFVRRHQFVCNHLGPLHLPRLVMSAIEEFFVPSLI